MAHFFNRFRIIVILSAFCSGFGAFFTAQAQEVRSPITPPSITEQQQAQNKVVILRALDKITARITEIPSPIGKEVRFGTLAITPKYCRSRPPEETPETFAYLEIYDIKRSGERIRAFNGWMMASNPALNALEHSVYDVWVINCITVEPSVEEPNS